MQDADRLPFHAGAAPISQQGHQPWGEQPRPQQARQRQQQQQWAEEQQEQQQNHQQGQRQGDHQQQQQQQEGLPSPGRRRLAKSGACKRGLWDVAKAAPDLQVLVAVQQLTPLNFFSPFGKASQRGFTLLAPTDAAWAALFGERPRPPPAAPAAAPLFLWLASLPGATQARGSQARLVQRGGDDVRPRVTHPLALLALLPPVPAGASYKQKVDLRDGLAALLLYHQVGGCACV